MLLGDAAHAMPHHLSQGACLAFEDAATLRVAAARRDRPARRCDAALEAYDRVRRPRAATVVRQTRRMSAVLQARGRSALRARDAALGTINSRLSPAPPPPPPSGDPADLTHRAAMQVRRSSGGRFGDAGGADAAEADPQVDPGDLLAASGQEDQVGAGGEELPGQGAR